MKTLFSHGEEKIILTALGAFLFHTDYLGLTVSERLRKFKLLSPE